MGMLQFFFFFKPIYFFPFFFFFHFIFFLITLKHRHSVNDIIHNNKLNEYLYYHLKGFPCLGSSFFLFKNILTPLCLSGDKTKGQSGKNIILTPTKTLPKK